MKRANANLSKRDLPPLTDKLTLHSTRRTFASGLYALAKPLPLVETGHMTTGEAVPIWSARSRAA